MSSENRAAEELKALAWYCAEENATGTNTDPYAYLGVGKTVFASYESQQLEPWLVMHGIYATGKVHDNGDYAELQLRFLTPYRDSERINPGLVKTAARVGLHVTDKDVLVNVERHKGEFIGVPLGLFVAPLGRWALQTFLAAEDPSAEFLHLLRTSDTTPTRSTIEAMMSKMCYPLDSSADVTELTDFFTAEDSRARLFERVYLMASGTYLRVEDAD